MEKGLQIHNRWSGVGMIVGERLQIETMGSLVVGMIVGGGAPNRDNRWSGGRNDSHHS